MTCYQRHIKWLFDAVELPYDKEGRARMDKALRAVLGIGPEQHCPDVWAALKAVPDTGRVELARELADELAAAGE